MTRPLAFLRRMRLTKKNDFARVFREGARARGAALLVVVARSGLAHSRLGLSVGRVIWKSAVKRNRVRRIFREAFRLSYAELPAGVDIVMIPAAPRLEPELELVRAELVSLARKALRRQGEPHPARTSGEEPPKVRPGGRGAKASETKTRDTMPRDTMPRGTKPPDSRPRDTTTPDAKPRRARNARGQEPTARGVAFESAGEP